MSSSFELPQNLESSQLQQTLLGYKKFIGHSALAISLAITGGGIAGAATAVFEPRPAVATANPGDYPDSTKPCVAVGDTEYGQTEGSGYWCNGYQWGDSPTQQDSSRGYGYRNCTDWAAWRIPQLGVGTIPRGWRNANNWDDAARASGKTVDATPEPGDIAVWNGGDYGHVEVVESVNPDGSVNTSGFNKRQDGNYGTQSGVRADAYIDLNGTGKGINNEQWPPVPQAIGVTALSSQMIGNSFHVYWATADGKLRETWFEPGVRGPFTNLLADFDSRITAISSQYSPNDMTQHVYTGDSEGTIRETWFNPNSGGYQTWQAHDTDSPITALTSRIESGGTQHLYWGSENGRVNKTWFNPTQGAHTWEIFRSNSSVYGITNQYTSDGLEHVYWGNNEGRLHESFFRPGWGPFTNLMADFPDTISSLASVTDPSGTQHVYSGSNDGKVRETWFNPNQPGGGYNTWEAGAFESAVHTVSAQYDQTGTQHIYSGTDHRVRETWFRPGTVNSWEAASSNTPIRAVSSQIDANGMQHVFWGTDDGKVRETWFVPGTVNTWELPE